MYKVLSVVLVAMLAACSSTKDPSVQAAEQARERRADEVKTVVKSQPGWYKDDCPATTAIACALATAQSDDMQASEDTAIELAKGKICDTAGGQVDKVSKTFRTQEGKNSTTNTKTAIRSFCDKVDITGAHLAKKETVAVGSYYQTYVKIVLPIDENPLKDRKDSLARARSNEVEGEKMLKELDSKQ
jgi:hypothetical protein